MKHFTIIISLLFIYNLNHAQTTFKTDTAAIAFAQQLAGSNAITVDTVNCKSCMDVQAQNVRVQFWKVPTGYRLASITGNETAVKKIWQTYYQPDASKTSIKGNTYYLNIYKINTSYRIACRELQ